MKKLKLEKNSILDFFIYINNCLASDCIKEHTSFNRLLMFHLMSVSHKLQCKQLDLVYKARQSVIVSLDYAEQITLSYMFNQVETTPFMKILEAAIIGGL